MRSISIHGSVTSTVTPAADPTSGSVTTLYAAFLAALHRHAVEAHGGSFFVSHRQLAAELDCSPGAIPRLMVRAEDAGVLIRRRYRNRYRLTLIDHGHRLCLAWESTVIDHAESDTPPAAADADSASGPDQRQPDAESGVIDQISAHVEDHESSQQQQHDAHARESRVRQVQLGQELWPIPWAQVTAANPGYTEADLQRDFAKLRTRPDLPTDIQRVRVLVAAKKRGEPIYSHGEIVQQATADLPPPPPAGPPPVRSASPPPRRGPRPPQVQHLSVIQTRTPTAEDADREAALWARAQQIAPPGLAKIALIGLVDDLEAGIAEAAALAALHARLAAQAGAP